MRVIVVGAGVAGLGAALALSRDGHDVRVLERDATGLPPTPVEAFEKWERRGAPQVRQSHAFLARLRNLLRDRAPDLLQSLLDAGAEELRFLDLIPPSLEDREPRPGDEDLVMLACRRITFEWVLRRCVLDGGVELRDGVRVEALLTDPTDRTPGAPPRVRGVRLRGQDGREERLEADLVVDASGRRSKLPAWLEEVGARRPEEQSEACGIFYCSRFYRLRPGATPPQRDTTIGADLGYLKYAIFHGDSRIFSITFAAPPDDPPLRALLRTGPFEAATEAIPAMAPWTDAACSEPITAVHGMDNLRNTRRFYVHDGEPLALGVVAIGDASIHTNPLYGRGCTFSMLHAYSLADAIRDHDGDARALALALEHATQREILPWYKLTVSQDRDAIEVAQAYQRGEDPSQPAGPASGNGKAPGAVDPKAYMRSLIRHGLLPALRIDPVVSRIFFRAFNLMDSPQDLMKDPQVLARTLHFYQNRGTRVEPSLGPDRPQMVELLAKAS